MKITHSNYWEVAFFGFCFVLFSREELIQGTVHGNMGTWTDSREASCTDSEQTGACLKQPWTKFIRFDRLGVQALPHKVVGETRIVNYWAKFSYQPHLHRHFPSFKETVGDDTLWSLAGWRRLLRTCLLYIALFQWVLPVNTSTHTVFPSSTTNYFFLLVCLQNTSIFVFQFHFWHQAVQWIL